MHLSSLLHQYIFVNALGEMAFMASWKHYKMQTILSALVASVASLN
jgi:hypothetical protein